MRSTFWISKIIFTFLISSAAWAQFSLLPNGIENEIDEMSWSLTDKDGKKITAIPNTEGTPFLTQSRKTSHKERNLWTIEYSTAPTGTSILTQIDYVIFLKEDPKKIGVFVFLGIEPIRLTRYHSGLVVYKKKRSLKTDLKQRVIQMGDLDEFSAKTIQIP